jgi:hypothetical protein
MVDPVVRRPPLLGHETIEKRKGRWKKDEPNQEADDLMLRAVSLKQPTRAAA